MDAQSAHKPLSDLEYDNAVVQNRIVFGRLTTGSLAMGVETEVIVPFDRAPDGKVPACILQRIYINKTAGPAATFDYAIKQKEAGTGPDIVHSNTGIVGTEDVFPAVPKIWVATHTTTNYGLMVIGITPNGGVGTFDILLVAEMKR